MAQSVCFFNSTILYHKSRKLFHTVANLTIARRTMASFLTWILRILTNTFVITSTGSHSSNGNTKFVKRERDIFKTWTTTILVIVNWTEWSTIQGVIGRVISNRPSALQDADLKLRARLPLNCTTRTPITN